MEEKRLQCIIRKEWVADQPEERLRQGVLNHLIHDLGYPSGLIVVESALSQLPHLIAEGKGCDRFPDRRVDILVYCVVDGEMRPLLLIECKAVPINRKTLEQVQGYNHFIRSPFFAVVNEHEVKTGWCEKGKGYSYISKFLSYSELRSSIQ